VEPPRTCRDPGELYATSETAVCAVSDYTSLAADHKWTDCRPQVTAMSGRVTTHGASLASP